MTVARFYFDQKIKSMEYGPEIIDYGKVKIAVGQSCESKGDKFYYVSVKTTITDRDREFESITKFRSWKVNEKSVQFTIAVNYYGDVEIEDNTNFNETSSEDVPDVFEID